MRREPPPKYYSSKHYESKYPDSRESSRPPHSYKREYYPPSSSGAYRDERDSYIRKDYPPRDDHYSSSVTFKYSAAESRGTKSYSKEGEKRLQFSEYVSKKNQNWYDDRSKDRPPSYSKSSIEKEKQS